jgi:hypothetical protein
MSKSKKATKTEEAAADASAPAVAAAPKAAPAPAKRTAAQTIEALENAFMGQNQQMQILADEIDKLRQMLVALSKRMNASIQAAEEGSLTGDSVNKIIINENVKELESKIQFLVDQGVLKKNDTMEITNQTFVVGREVDATGKIINPRVQFAVGSIDQAVQAKLLTKKMGDTVSYSDTEPSLEITEVYEIHQPAVQKNFEAQPTAQS